MRSAREGPGPQDRLDEHEAASSCRRRAPVAALPHAVQTMGLLWRDRIDERKPTRTARRRRPSPYAPPAATPCLTGERGSAVQKF